MASFNIDITAIFSYASTIFNNLMPIAAIGAGISLGVAMLGLLVRVIKSAVSSM
jgi:uncharacterized membrane protein YdfJ with MMPL/SSD domain